MQKCVLMFFLLLAPYMVYAQTDSVCCGDSVSEAWAEANKDRIAMMTRSEWLKLPTDGIRRAAYTRFTPKQRVQFWKDKLTDIAADDKLSEKEKSHVMKLYDFIDSHQGLFTGKQITPEQETEVNAFMAGWMQTAERQFRWSRQMVYSIAASGEEMVIKYEND